MLVLARSGGFAIAAGASAAAGQGFRCGGQQSKDQSQAEVAHCSHESVVVWGVLCRMLRAGHPVVAHGVHALATELTCFLKGHLPARVGQQKLLCSPVAVVLMLIAWGE
jgi:hypothetical protein